MTITQVQFDALVARVKAAEDEVAALRVEMGAIVDAGAAPIHTRIQQLGEAFLTMAERLEDIPGGQLASDVIVARVATLIPPASSEMPPGIVTDADGRIGIGMSPIPGLEHHVFLRSPVGGGIYVEMDSNKNNSQRQPNGSHSATAPFVFTFGGSDDAGGGANMNLVYPVDGRAPYIPDGTRYGMSARHDSEGMLSFNLFEPDLAHPNADGTFPILATHKGQLAVFIPDPNGDFTIRLPQGGTLYLEEGNGNNDRVDGHKAFVSRRPVLLGADVGTMARSKL